MNTKIVAVIAFIASLCFLLVSIMDYYDGKIVVAIVMLVGFLLEIYIGIMNLRRKDK